MKVIPTIGSRVTPNFRAVETTLETDDGDLSPLNLYYQPGGTYVYRQPDGASLYLTPTSVVPVESSFLRSTGTGTFLRPDGISSYKRP